MIFCLFRVQVLIPFTVLFGQNWFICRRWGKKSCRTCFLQPPTPFFSDLFKAVGQAAVSTMVGVVRVLFV